MTEREKEVLMECMKDAIKCSINTVYECLAILFEEMANHPELNLQETLIAMSLALRKLLPENKDEQNF